MTRMWKNSIRRILKGNERCSEKVMGRVYVGNMHVSGRCQLYWVAYTEVWSACVASVAMKASESHLPSCTCILNGFLSRSELVYTSPVHCAACKMYAECHQQVVGSNHPTSGNEHQQA